MQFKITRVQLLSGLVLLAVAAGIGVLAIPSGTSPAPVSAAGGGVEVATFTKWVTAADSFPWSMVGVVGGDVGEGTYAGQVLSYDPTVANGNTTRIVANYQFNGPAHTFSALVEVKQDNQTGRAVIKGVVTDGWQEGALVRGEYETMPVCAIATPGNIFGTTCFKGTLRILPASPQ